MSRESVAERRWNRKRKLLPTLRLRYPTDTEIERISALVKVDDPSAFGQHIRSIILDAHLNDARLRNLSVPRVRKILNAIATQADRLQAVLTAIDVGGRGSAYRAGQLLELEFSELRFREAIVLLPEWVSLLNILATAARRAAPARKAKRGRRGGGGNPAFDLFIQALLMAARQRGGHWTIYRSADGRWTGSLLTALEILEPYLPRGFMPIGQLGRSVENIRTKLNAYITKHQGN
jgi:hypothetical protein